MDKQPANLNCSSVVMGHAEFHPYDPKLIDAETAKQIATDHLTNPYEVISARAVIDKAPAIDPVHAAGGCYCRECECHGDDGWCWLYNYRTNMEDFCSNGEQTTK